MYEKTLRYKELEDKARQEAEEFTEKGNWQDAHYAASVSSFFPFKDGGRLYY